MKRYDPQLKEAVLGYKKKLAKLCTTEPVAIRCSDMALALGLTPYEMSVLIAVHALECLKSTQQDLLEARMEAPPDSIFVRNEDGTRSLIHYIGPTIEELRKERK